MATLVHVEHVWDTVVSLHLEAPDETVLPVVVERAVAWVHEVDRVLSPFRPDSDLCRWQRGELDLGGCHPMVPEVLDLAVRAQRTTGGAFDLGWSDAGPDPTGLVKGWAVDHIVTLAQGHGVHDLQVNAGGDVRTAGQRPGGGPWRTGVEHPLHSDRLLDVVEAHDLAVATSGSRHRGAHVKPARPDTVPVASVTVVGEQLALADAYSTAALSLGTEAPDLLAGLDDRWPSLVCFTDDTTWALPGWRKVTSSKA